MSKKKELDDDAAGGVSTTASPGALKIGSTNTKKVMYCTSCSFHLLLDIDKSDCSSCKKEMKEIGWIEYAKD